MSVRKLDLSNPENAKKFLAGLRQPGGEKLIHATIDGLKYNLPQLEDELAVNVAKYLEGELFAPCGIYYVEAS